jgi:hypothetical protein
MWGIPRWETGQMALFFGEKRLILGERQAFLPRNQPPAR